MMLKEALGGDDAAAHADPVHGHFAWRALLPLAVATSIDALAAGDDSVLARLTVVLRNPYDDQPAHDDLAERRPEWARHKAGCSALSCSS